MGSIKTRFEPGWATDFALSFMRMGVNLGLHSAAVHMARIDLKDFCNYLLVSIHWMQDFPLQSLSRSYNFLYNFF